MDEKHTEEKIEYDDVIGHLDGIDHIVSTVTPMIVQFLEDPEKHEVESRLFKPELGTNANMPLCKETFAYFKAIGDSLDEDPRYVKIGTVKGHMSRFDRNVRMFTAGKQPGKYQLKIPKSTHIIATPDRLCFKVAHATEQYVDNVKNPVPYEIVRMTRMSYRRIVEHSEFTVHFRIDVTKQDDRVKIKSDWDRTDKVILLNKIPYGVSLSEIRQKCFPEQGLMTSFQPLYDKNVYGDEPSLIGAYCQYDTKDTAATMLTKFTELDWDPILFNFIKNRQRIMRVLLYDSSSAEDIRKEYEDKGDIEDVVVTKSLGLIVFNSVKFEDSDDILPPFNIRSWLSLEVEIERVDPKNKKAPKKTLAHEVALSFLSQTLAFCGSHELKETKDGQWEKVPLPLPKLTLVK